MGTGKQLWFSMEHLTERDQQLLTIYAAFEDGPLTRLKTQVESDRFIVSTPGNLDESDEQEVLELGLIRAGHSYALLDILGADGREGAETVASVKGMVLDGRFSGVQVL